MKKRSIKEMAARMIVYWIGKAWHDLDNPHYQKRRRVRKKRLSITYTGMGFLSGGCCGGGIHRIN